MRYLSKKPALCFFAFGIALYAQAQHNSLLIYHDTAVLKAEACNWVVRSLVKNDPALTAGIGKTVPELIFNAIKKGKLKAFDMESNTLIPAAQIYTWKVPQDTVMIADAGNDRMMVVQRQHNMDNFTRLRIYQDWYMDIRTGRLNSVIKWIEPLQDVYTPDGTYLGQLAWLRVYY